MARSEKEAVVKEFGALLNSYPIIGIVNMEHLPAKQLQIMRSSLRQKGIVLKMTKRRLLLKAFDGCTKADLGHLKAHFTGMPALIFTKENPFSLFKLLKKSQSKAPIKTGQTAPDDIIVPAGPTGFAPGPVIGELGSIGVKTQIVDGKVAVKEDSKVATAGQTVDAKLAGLLARLGIEPMRIGLNIAAVYEDGKILTKEILDIDEDAYIRNLTAAHSEAFGLAMEIGYPTTETIRPLLQRAFIDATILALERNILNRETVAPLLGRAYAMSLAVSGLLPDEALSAEAKAASTAATAAPPAEGGMEKKDEKDEKKPEDAAAGLGSLFG